ncbi:S8 family serine peptidase [candidate division KSB1 bacterium]|nr:S8 family serine peptidase [candidate division KSB1 bacterium]
MRKGLYFIGLAVLTIIISAAVNQPKAPEYVEGELLVKFSTAITAQDVNSAMVQIGAEAVERLPFVDVYHLKITTAKSVKKAVEEFSALPNVIYAEPNYIYTTMVIPNDPKFNDLWAMLNSGQTGGLAGADISATTAWDLATGSTEVLVGVIDTGIDYTHADLASNIYTNPAEDAWSNPNDPSTGDHVDNDGNGKVDDWKGWNFVDNSNDAYDDNMHGTHCAGSIGAVGNNGVGVVGVNWNVKMVPLKFLDSNGSGSSADAIKAIEYATALGVHVMSNSWGGGGFSQAMEDAIQKASDRGILFVAAAGNDGTDNDAIPHYPSNYEVANVVAVAASDHGDKRALWGSSGGDDGCGFVCSNAVAAVPGSNYGKTTVDIAAPGKNILSTVPGNSYASLSGTSMAAPHIAGAAALLLSVKPDLTIDGLKTALFSTVDPLDDFTNKIVTGGRLNLRTAVESVLPTP